MANSQQDHQAAMHLSKILAQELDYSRLAPAERRAVLSQRVTYAEAAEKVLCISRKKLSQLVRDGEIPVLQKPSGTRPGLIEVGALQDYLDRLRSQANSEAARRSEVADKRGRHGSAA